MIRIYMPMLSSLIFIISSFANANDVGICRRQIRDSICLVDGTGTENKSVSELILRPC